MTGPYAGQSRQTRAGVVLAMSLAVLLIAIACTDEPDEPDALDPELALLRLPDLPSNYTIGDDSGCGAITFEGASDRLTTFLRASGMAPFCTRQFEDYSNPERPEVVMSSIVTFASEDTASDALDHLDELVGLQLGLDTDEELAPSGGPGAEALALAVGSFMGPGAVYGWRSGPYVQYVAVTGSAAPEAHARAVDLAGVQQGRLDEPTPLMEADTDDAEVALDRAGDHPVYWLGRKWDPDDAVLPTLEIRASWADPERGLGPGFGVKIDYVVAEDQAPGVDVGTWSLERWHQFLESDLGRYVISGCDEPRVIGSADRRIEVGPRAGRRGRLLRQCGGLRLLQGCGRHAEHARMPRLPPGVGSLGDPGCARTGRSGARTAPVVRSGGNVSRVQGPDEHECRVQSIVVLAAHGAAGPTCRDGVPRRGHDRPDVHGHGPIRRQALHARRPSVRTTASS